jgi:hypothetical protein
MTWRTLLMKTLQLQTYVTSDTTFQRCISAYSGIQINTTTRFRSKHFVSCSLPWPRDIYWSAQNDVSYKINETEDKFFLYLTKHHSMKTLGRQIQLHATLTLALHTDEYLTSWSGRLTLRAHGIWGSGPDRHMGALGGLIIWRPSKWHSLIICSTSYFLFIPVIFQRLWQVGAQGICPAGLPFFLTLMMMYGSQSRCGRIFYGELSK